ncbi:MAG TPA: hypothetical protein VJC16_05800 [Candidatus Nanoarchaeia archaeon]|nr:hypothetical protein [Candidatus Nanoarchaeia archaeon]
MDELTTLVGKSFDETQAYLIGRVSEAGERFGIFTGISHFEHVANNISNIVQTMLFRKRVEELSDDDRAIAERELRAFNLYLRMVEQNPVFRKQEARSAYEYNPATPNGVTGYVFEQAKRFGME